MTALIEQLLPEQPLNPHAFTTQDPQAEQLLTNGEQLDAHGEQLLPQDDVLQEDKHTGAGAPA
ncbi:MAG: hypothetical protein MK102_19210 [Fuerstiella sp.]|nr:hypothetical protein [Fuerstiella sp.]